LTRNYGSVDLIWLMASTTPQKVLGAIGDFRYYQFYADKSAKNESLHNFSL
jgi:hypothetical protein